ncbi:MAG: hypothetical protein E7473_10905 [Ruminococcaceae bacterium]|nr:hypothetical protein [Oscillospiraceae bacterium]
MNITLQTTATKMINYTSGYRDISDKERFVKHQVISGANDKENEERIVKELYRIFMHKAN